MAASEITCADLLREYASAIRGSWGDIDGRTERYKLEGLAYAIDKFGNLPLLPLEVTDLRWTLDVCPNGSGHWTEFCADYRCTHQDEK